MPPQGGGAQAGGPFNSLFEMLNKKVSRRVYLTSLLSILYLRCRRRLRAAMSGGVATLSILYLRCIDSRAVAMVVARYFQFSI